LQVFGCSGCGGLDLLNLHVELLNGLDEWNPEVQALAEYPPCKGVEPQVYAALAGCNCSKRRKSEVVVLKQRSFFGR
jgi:hypothetical protein